MAIVAECPNIIKINKKMIFQYFKTVDDYHNNIILSCFINKCKSCTNLI